MRKEGIDEMEDEGGIEDDCWKQVGGTYAWHVDYVGVYGYGSSFSADRIPVAIKPQIRSRSTIATKGFFQQI